MAAFKYLSEALPRALKNSGLSQKDLGAVAGLPPSQINRYCKGVNHPPLESFEKLMGALPADQRSLVAVAYLRDCMPPDYRDVVVIQPVSDRVAEDEGVPPLIPGIDAELDALLRKYADLAMRHTEVRAMLQTFISAIGVQPPPGGSAPAGA